MGESAVAENKKTRERGRTFFQTKGKARSRVRAHHGRDVARGTDQFDSNATYSSGGVKEETESGPSELNRTDGRWKKCLGPRLGGARWQHTTKWTVHKESLPLPMNIV